MLDFAARFFQPNDHYVQMDSMRSGKFHITGATIRNRGQAVPVMSDSRRNPFQIHFSERSSCRSWMRIVTLIRCALSRARFHDLLSL